MTHVLASVALKAELARIVEAVNILSPSSFTFAGQNSTGVFQPVWGLMVPSAAPPLMGELIQQLYKNCYLNSFLGVATEANPSQFFDDPAWIEILSRANMSRDRWDDGWIVVANMPHGQLLAQRGAITRRLSPGEFINFTSPGMLPAVGASLRVYSPREARNLQPGFYYAFGEAPQEACNEFSVVRFYWHISVDGAPELLRLVSGELNRWQIPFRLKIVNHPEMFSRSDAALLYLARRYVHIGVEILVDIRRRIQLQLLDNVPLFTMKLGPGLAFAEDPGNSESFGTARCRLLAEGIWAAFQRGTWRTEDRLGIVEEHFKTQGISLERPWLSPGSTGDFGFGVDEPWAA